MTSPPAEPSARPPGGRRPLGCAAAVLGSVLILAALAAFVFYQTLVVPERVVTNGADRVERWARQVHDAFAVLGALQPRVVVNDRVILEQSTPTLELTVLDWPTEVEHEFAHTFLGSTKRVRLRGDYVVRAGYDLREPFTVQVRGDALTPGAERVVRVALPPATILGVEQRELSVVEMRNGLWNRVQAQELSAEVNLLPAQAREKARAAGIAGQAEEALAQRLRAQLGPGWRVEIVREPLPPAPTPTPGPRLPVP